MLGRWVRARGVAAHIVLSRAREAATDLDGVVAEAELVELAVAELGEEADVEAARQGLELERLGHQQQEVGRVPRERAVDDADLTCSTVEPRATRSVACLPLWVSAR